MDISDYGSVDAFVAENREMLVRVLRHSNDAYARACAWALLDMGGDAPEIDQLQQELAVLERAK